MMQRHRWIRGLRVVIIGAALLVSWNASLEAHGSDAEVAAGDESGLTTEKAQKAAALYRQAMQYQRDRKWHELADTQEELLKLMPKDAKLRRFVAWNLAYNLSAEADDVEERYAWIRRGLRVLIEGIELDPHTVTHWHNTGWDLAFKIGTSDESLDYRRLFAEDEPFHGQIRRHVAIDEAVGLDGKPDCWLVGRLFFVRANEMILKEGASLGDASAPISFARPAMCMTHFAEALNKEGRFDDNAVQAWCKAENEWKAYGDIELTTPFEFSIKLNDLDHQVGEVTRLWSNFDRLQPGLQKRLRAEAHAKQSARSRPAPDEHARKRTVIELFEQLVAADNNTKPVRLTYEMLHESVAGPKRGEALRIGEQALAAEKRADAIRTSRAIVNLDSYLLRCRLERSDVLIEARRRTYEAGQQLAKARTTRTPADISRTKQLYDEAFRIWATVFDKFGDASNERFIRQDVLDVVWLYRQVFLAGADLPDHCPIREKVLEWEPPRD